MTKKAAQKSDKMTGRKTGVLVKQKHGGALLNGMAPNHVPGPGRPPDEVRAKMRELGATKGLPFLSDLLDGKIAVSLLGKCDACEHDQPLSEEWVEMVMERLKASVDQRLKATEQTMKYGLSSKELVIASGNAATFFDCVHRAVVELYGESGAEQVKARAVSLMENAG